MGATACGIGGSVEEAKRHAELAMWQGLRRKGGAEKSDFRDDADRGGRAEGSQAGCLQRTRPNADLHEPGTKRRPFPIFTGGSQQKLEKQKSSSSDTESWCLIKSSGDDLNTTTSSEEFTLLTSSSDERKQSGRGEEDDIEVLDRSSSIEVIEEDGVEVEGAGEDDWTTAPREPLKFNGLNTDGSGTNAVNAADEESIGSSRYIIDAGSVGRGCHVIDAVGTGRGVLSEPWAPANQGPEIGGASLVTGRDQRLDATKEHRLGSKITPVKHCAVSLFRYEGAEPRRFDERLVKLGAEEADARYEPKDEAQDRTESPTIEGARPSVPSGCPN